MEKPAGRRKRAGVMRERRQQRTSTTATQRQPHCISTVGSHEGRSVAGALRGMGRDPVLSRKKLGVGLCASRNAADVKPGSLDGIRSQPPLHSTGSKNLSCTHVDLGEMTARGKREREEIRREGTGRDREGLGREG